MMYAVLAGVFCVLFALALLAMYLPSASAARAARAARLEEIQRYGRPAVKHAGAGAYARSGAPTALGQQALGMFDRALRARGRRGDVAADLEGAGLRIRPEEWAAVQISACVIAGAGLYVVLGSFFGLPIGALLGWFGCRMFLKIRRSRREAAFLEQVPETLQLVAGSLAAGFSLAQSLGTVVKEGTEPTAGEFNRALTEARLGANLEDALDGVAQRMRCDDLAWVVMAIRISREVGGNLAEVINTTVATMRSRAELRGLVKALSAEGRASAKVLAALPFVVALALSVMNPHYLTPLFHTGTGIVLLCIGGVLISLGIWWLSRLVQVKM